MQDVRNVADSCAIKDITMWQISRLALFASIKKKKKPPQATFGGGQDAAAIRSRHM